MLTNLAMRNAKNKISDIKHFGTSTENFIHVCTDERLNAYFRVIIYKANLYIELLSDSDGAWRGAVGWRSWSTTPVDTVSVPTA